MKQVIADEEAMLAMGRRFAADMPGGKFFLITLQGDLGAGKTTFCRGLLQALGHAGPVRSPTYTIIESYDLAAHRVHHLDLYRLAEADELEYIGGRDLFSEASIMLVEWPERGQGWLPTADIAIRIDCHGQERFFSAAALTPAGRVLLARIQAHSPDVN